MEYKLYSQKLIKLRESEIIEDEIQDTQNLPVVADKKMHKYKSYREEAIYTQRDVSRFLDSLRNNRCLKNYKDPVYFDLTFENQMAETHIDYDYLGV